jgi:tetratricopeptide (TPR) repeat protein
MTHYIFTKAGLDLVNTFMSVEMINERLRFHGEILMTTPQKELANVKLVLSRELSESASYNLPPFSGKIYMKVGVERSKTKICELDIANLSWYDIYRFSKEASTYNSRIMEVVQCPAKPTKVTTSPSSTTTVQYNYSSELSKSFDRLKKELLKFSKEGEYHKAYKVYERMKRHDMYKTYKQSIDKFGEDIITLYQQSVSSSVDSTKLDEKTVSQESIPNPLPEAQSSLPSLVALPSKPPTFRDTTHDEEFTKKYDEFEQLYVELENTTQLNHDFVQKLEKCYSIYKELKDNFPEETLKLQKMEDQLLNISRIYSNLNKFSLKYEEFMTEYQTKSRYEELVKILREASDTFKKIFPTDPDLKHKIASMGRILDNLNVSFHPPVFQEPDPLPPVVAVSPRLSLPVHAELRQISTPSPENIQSFPRTLPEEEKNETQSETPLERYMKKFNVMPRRTLKILTNLTEIYSALKDLQSYDGEILVSGKTYSREERKTIVTYDIYENNLNQIPEFENLEVLESLVSNGPYGIIAFYFLVREVLLLKKDSDYDGFPSTDDMFESMTTETMKVMIDHKLLFLLQHVLEELGKTEDARPRLGEAIDIDTICHLADNDEMYDFFASKNSEIRSVDFAELIKIMVHFKDSIPLCFLKVRNIWLYLEDLRKEEIQRVLLPIIPFIKTTEIYDMMDLFRFLISQKEHLSDQFYHDLVASDTGTVVCFYLSFRGCDFRKDILFERTFVLIKYYLSRLAILTFLALGYNESETVFLLHQGITQLQKQEPSLSVSGIQTYLNSDSELYDEIIKEEDSEDDNGPSISQPQKIENVIQETIKKIESDFEDTPEKKGSPMSDDQDRQIHESEPISLRRSRTPEIDCSKTEINKKNTNALPFLYDLQQKVYYMKLGSEFVRMDCPILEGTTLRLRFGNTLYTYSQIESPPPVSGREKQYIYIGKQWRGYDKKIHHWVNGQWTSEKAMGGKGKTKKASRFRAHKYISEKHASFQKSIYRRSIRHIPRKSFRH